ncbi:NUDIX hydrolase [Iodidimonas gelatinilytica]|uniref:NUDIX hydrolase n=1 Tax=Iodidimonas gelatinilytica TaxID=1236966 RepID=A0A5A7N093_9PROT|nr:NUDIX domain-containing protein [Iodidimonas gelatinilytica]GER01437.1 NUDIX hydrolase [Iodidimonas gelatinilytica]
MIWPQGFTPVNAEPAASVLLIRDGGQGLEVLMVERSRAMTFASGMLVFPGGRVDAADKSTALLQATDHNGRTGRRLPRDWPFRVAAIREVFEETGLICARTGVRNRLPAEQQRQRLARSYRRRLHQGALSFKSLIRIAGLRLPLADLMPFAHWITPELSPKRFDTRFYLARAPYDQKASSDGIENLHLEWRRPCDLLAAWDAGVQPLMFPTRLNLMKLARADTVADALRQTRQTPIITVTPEIVGTGKRRLVIPEEAGFGLTIATQHDLHPIERSLVSDEAKSALEL